jgi:hypothetical protein
MKSWLQLELEDDFDEELEQEIDDARIPAELRKLQVTRKKSAIDRGTYFRELLRLQGELVKLQDWERAGQHAIEPLHAHFAKEADLCEMRQAIGIIGVGFVRSHIDCGFGMAGIDTDRRQSFCAQSMIEPHGERAGLEHNALCSRGMLADEVGNDLWIRSASPAPDLFAFPSDRNRCLFH